MSYVLPGIFNRGGMKVVLNAQTRCCTLKHARLVVYKNFSVHYT